jgi:hypothetical protein
LGSLIISRNLAWNGTDWDHQDDTQPASVIEVGDEGVTLHAVPAGSTTASDQHHELFQARSNGAEALYSGVPSTGKWLQAKVPLFMAYDQSAYTGDDAHSWGNNYQPFIYLLSNEGLAETTPPGTWIRLEQCSSEYSTGAQIHFLKSRGTPGSKAAGNAADVAGVLSFGQWDGSVYQVTARILAQCTNAPQEDSVPQKLCFQTSGSTPANMSTRLTIGPQGEIWMHDLPSSDPHSGGQLYKDNGVVKVSAG